MKTAVHILAFLMIYHNVFKLVILAQESIHSVTVIYHFRTRLLFNQISGLLSR